MKLHMQAVSQSRQLIHSQWSTIKFCFSGNKMPESARSFTMQLYCVQLKFNRLSVTQATVNKILFPEMKLTKCDEGYISDKSDLSKQILHAINVTFFENAIAFRSPLCRYRLRFTRPKCQKVQKEVYSIKFEPGKRISRALSDFTRIFDHSSIARDHQSTNFHCLILGLMLQKSSL